MPGCTRMSTPSPTKKRPKLNPSATPATIPVPGRGVHRPLIDEVERRPAERDQADREHGEADAARERVVDVVNLHRGGPCDAQAFAGPARSDQIAHAETMPRRMQPRRARCRAEREIATPQALRDHQRPGLVGLEDHGHHAALRSRRKRRRIPRTRSPRERAGELSPLGAHGHGHQRHDEADEHADDESRQAAGHRVV